MKHVWTCHDSAQQCHPRQACVIACACMLFAAQRLNREHCATAGKTFEVRRSEAADARGKAMTPSAFQQLFLGLALDRHRARIGLLPFPKASTVLEAAGQSAPAPR